MKKALILVTLFVLGMSVFGNTNPLKMSINGGEEIMITSVSLDIQSGDEVTIGMYVTAELNPVTLFLEEKMLQKVNIGEIVINAYNFNKVRYKTILRDVNIYSYNETISTYEVVPSVYFYFTFAEREVILFEDGKETAKLLYKAEEKLEETKTEVASESK